MIAMIECGIRRELEEIWICPLGHRHLRQAAAQRCADKIERRRRNVEEMEATTALSLADILLLEVYRFPIAMRNRRPLQRVLVLDPEWSHLRSFDSLRSFPRDAVVWDVVKHTERELGLLRGIGIEALFDIKGTLDDLGLSLGMAIDSATIEEVMSRLPTKADLERRLGGDK